MAGIGIYMPGAEVLLNSACLMYFIKPYQMFIRKKLGSFYLPRVTPSRTVTVTKTAMELPSFGTVKIH